MLAAPAPGSCWLRTKSTQTDGWVQAGKPPRLAPASGKNREARDDRPASRREVTAGALCAFGCLAKVCATPGRKRERWAAPGGRKSWHFLSVRLWARGFLFMSSVSSRLSVSVTQSCPTLCNPMDCSSPGSSVHGILQARRLECPDPGIEPGTPALQADSLPSEPPGKPLHKCRQWHQPLGTVMQWTAGGTAQTPLQGNPCCSSGVPVSTANCRQRRTTGLQRPASPGSGPRTDHCKK